MKKALKDFYKPNPKPKTQMCQAQVNAELLQSARKAAKAQNMKFKEAVETALRWFIEQSKEVS